jgi:hypothetical protein
MGPRISSQRPQPIIAGPIATSSAADHVAPGLPRRLDDASHGLTHSVARHPPSLAQPLLSQHSVLDLQRRFGNQYVSGLLLRHARLSGETIQRQPDDLQGGPDKPGESAAFDCSVKKDPRCIPDKLQLQAPFWTAQPEAGSTLTRLNIAFHNNPPLEQRGGQGQDVVTVLKRALNSVVNVSSPAAAKLDESTGWDQATKQRVFTFQADNGIPPSGFEAGRKTLLALDAHLQQDNPVPPQPKPKPDPSRGPVLTIVCAEGPAPPGANSDSVQLGGTGFAAKTGVTIAIDNDLSGFAATDNQGTFSFQVPTVALPAGAHSIFVISGANETALASLTLPCRAQPSPNPQPGPFNPELEALLDRIDVAYQLLVTRQRDGVLAFCRDMAAPDFPKVALTDSEKIFIRVLWNALYGPAEGSIRFLVAKFILGDPDLSDLGSKLVDNAIDKPFDGFNQDMQDQAGKAVAQESKGEREDAVAHFCDARLDEVTQAGFGLADKFAREGKPTLRAPVPPDPNRRRKAGNQSGDPRVDGALAALSALNSETVNVFRLQYDQMVSLWNKVMVATGGKGGDVPKEKIDNATNLAPFVAGTELPAGIFLVTLKSQLAQNFGVAIDKTMVDGLSQRLRHDIADRAKTVGQLTQFPPKFEGEKVGGFPVVAEGSMPIPSNPTSGFRTLVRVGINEIGQAFDLSGPDGPTNSSAQWLQVHGGGDRATGFVILTKEVSVAALGEIGPVEKSPISG